MVREKVWGVLFFVCLCSRDDDGWMRVVGEGVMFDRVVEGWGKLWGLWGRMKMKREVVGEWVER